MGIKDYLVEKKISIIFLCVVIVIGFIFNENDKQIFEIKDIPNAAYNEEANIATIEKHYIVSNSPISLNKLKEIVIKFDKENPVDYSYAEKYLSKIRGENVKLEEVRVVLFFYRETGAINRHWKEDLSFISDTIEDHKEDLVGIVRYSNKDEIREIDLMRKSRDGKVIREMNIKGGNIRKTINK